MTEVEEQTEFKFSELSDTAKDAARATHTGEGYLEYDWWDHTYEDAVRMAAILGITISTTWHKNRHGRDYQTTDIQFSGFCSQGDGACFAGSYSVAPNASALIREETNDETLHGLADRLGMLQVTRKLQGAPEFTAIITTSGRYCHSGMMSVDVNSEDEDDEHAQISLELEDAVTQVLRDFADWIYKQLNNEHDWLHSDECVDESLTEEIFDENGAVL